MCIKIVGQFIKRLVSPPFSTCSSIKCIDLIRCASPSSWSLVGEQVRGLRLGASSSSISSTRSLKPFLCKCPFHYRVSGAKGDSCTRWSFSLNVDHLGASSSASTTALCADNVFQFGVTGKKWQTERHGQVSGSWASESHLLLRKHVTHRCIICTPRISNGCLQQRRLTGVRFGGSKYLVIPDWRTATKDWWIRYQMHLLELDRVFNATPEWAVIKITHHVDESPPRGWMLWQLMKMERDERRSRE